MPLKTARSTKLPAVIAPDGIAIHAFELPPACYVGLAEGRIPPGRYAVHRHLTIEQYTYVLSGELTAVTLGGADSAASSLELRAGDLLLTLPGESLQFANGAQHSARVLFICAPPYPTDDSDTHLLLEHAPESVEERRAAIFRLEELRARTDAIIDTRISELERGLPS